VAACNFFICADMRGQGPLQVVKKKSATQILPFNCSLPNREPSEAVNSNLGTSPSSGRPLLRQPASGSNSRIGRYRIVSLE